MKILNLQRELTVVFTFTTPLLFLMFIPLYLEHFGVESFGFFSLSLMFVSAFSIFDALRNPLVSANKKFGYVVHKYFKTCLLKYFKTRNMVLLSLFALVLILFSFLADSSLVRFIGIFIFIWPLYLFAVINISKLDSLGLTGITAVLRFLTWFFALLLAYGLSFKVDPKLSAYGFLVTFPLILYLVSQLAVFVVDKKEFKQEQVAEEAGQYHQEKAMNFLLERVKHQASYFLLGVGQLSFERIIVFLMLSSPMFGVYTAITESFSRLQIVPRAVNNYLLPRSDLDSFYRVLKKTLLPMFLSVCILGLVLIYFSHQIILTYYFRGELNGYGFLLYIAPLYFFIKSLGYFGVLSLNLRSDYRVQKQYYILSILTFVPLLIVLIYLFDIYGAVIGYILLRWPDLAIFRYSMIRRDEIA